MTDASMNATVETLAARLDRLTSLDEIRQLVAKYCLALDMRALDARLSNSGNIRDAVALYKARKSRRQKSAYDQA